MVDFSRSDYVKQLDWSPIQDIGNTIYEGRKRGAVNEAVAGINSKDPSVQAAAMAQLASLDPATHKAFLTQQLGREHIASSEKISANSLAERALQHKEQAAQNERMFKLQEYGMKDKGSYQKTDDGIFWLPPGGGTPLKVVDDEGNVVARPPTAPNAPPSQTPAPVPAAPGPQSSISPQSLQQQGLAGGPVQGQPQRIQLAGDIPTPDTPAAAAQPTAVAAPKQPTPADIEYLTKNPAVAPKFEKAFGWAPGMAEQYIANAQARPAEDIATNLPAGVNKKAAKQEAAKKLMDQRAVAQIEAQSAEKYAPTLQTALQAYEKLNELGGIGRITGNPMMVGARGIASSVLPLPGNQAEIARWQAVYNKAQNDLALMKAATMKGQGTISNYERGIVNSTIPSLNDLATAGPNSAQILRNLVRQNYMAQRLGRQDVRP